MNSRIFQSFCWNLSNDFWENYFHKPKLLSIANRLIYFNISIGVSKFHGPRYPSVQIFLHRLTILWSNYLIWYLFHEVETPQGNIAKLFSVNCFSQNASSWMLDVVDVWISLEFWIYQSFQYTGVLNISGFFEVKEKVSHFPVQYSEINTNWFRFKS